CGLVFVVNIFDFIILSSFIYRPHFNCAPQLVHVLQPPISSICPSLQTGHVLPTSEPISTFVLSSSFIVFITTTFLDGSVSNNSVCSPTLFSSAFKVNTCESRLPST